jgi:hypothetical protein
MYLATNGRLPNGDSSWVGYNDNTVIRYTGTITIPTTTAHPAGSVYRIYFYNNTDDGFKLLINGTTVINQNSTDTWQKLIGYTSNGWLDVVAGQTYNLEGWYWNVLGGVGHRFYWDYGAGVQGVPNSAFTTGTISTATIDTTGVSYTGGVVDVTGAVVAMYPDYVTNNSGSSITVAEGAGSSVITDDQQAAINDVTTRKAAMSAGNHVYIEQVGDSNTITILQTSNNNVVKGVGQTAALINGDSNNITIRQGNPAGSTAGRNLLELNLVGDANTLNLNQAQTTTGGYNTADSNDHYQLINVTGSRNSVTTEQTNINSTQVGHFLETTVSGNDNTLDLRQSSAGKTMFVNVNGNSNSATVQQKDLGNHHLDLKMTGDGNNAIILQEGNVGHKATVDMSRGSGGANMLDLSQSSNTNPLSFSIQQTCNQANCGTVVIRQTQ